jgi:ParB family transcriptional regulator, chromosome partitioning protein
LALIENIQREDLNPIEETEAILQLLSLELEVPDSEVSPLLHRLKHEADQARGETGHNVMPSSELQQVQAVFTRLGQMSWQSFVKNRLPLLNLPAGLLEAVMSGRLDYTKAIALGRIKDEAARADALQQTLAEDWSINQIRDHIKQLKPPTQEAPLKQQFEATYQRAKKAKVWEDPAKQAKLSKLLRELETLLEK